MVKTESRLEKKSGPSALDDQKRILHVTVREWDFIHWRNACAHKYPDQHSDVIFYLSDYIIGLDSNGSKGVGARFMEMDLGPIFRLSTLMHLAGNWKTV